MRNFFKILGVEDWRNLMTRDELLHRLRQHSKDKHYVYVIWRNDKPHSEPMYVGKGIRRRALHHFYKSDKSNRIKSGILEKMRIRGCEPIFSIIGSELTDEEAMALEVEVIRKVGRIITRDGPLSNLKEGGEGEAHSKARRGKHGMARAVYANGTRYEIMSDAAKALGVHLSAIHKRINNGWPGYYYEDVGQLPRKRPSKHSREHISVMRKTTNNHSKRVMINGQQFRSMSAAAASLGISYATVRNRCSNGDRGYKFID